MANVSDNVAILGAGLAGSLLAVLLKKAGFDVNVFEKRVDPRFSRMPEGRSINLALSHRGIRALESAGVFHGLKTDLIPMHGRMMHDRDGKLTFQPYGKEGQYINSVSRNELNKALIAAADKEGAQFHFGHKVERVDPDGSSFVVSNNNRYSSHKADLIIGADGAFSALRKSMQHRGRFNYQQEYIGHGYKELSMPSVKNDFAMEPNNLHIWPRGDFMLIALPNPDKTFTCTLFLAFEGSEAFERLHSGEEVMNFFEKHFPDVPPLIPDLVDQFQQNPTSPLLTIRCEPWYQERCMLIGDAAHAIVPFYGQGMNAAFEDCRLFMEVATEMNFEWDRLLPHFCQSRVRNANAIADLALRNFKEMRDKVADDNFLERKKVEARLHERFGRDWIPLYTMVTFTDLPYQECLERGIRQDKLLLRAQQEGYLVDIQRIHKGLFEDIELS